ncbi:MAG: hypothetical protein RLZZ557_2218, partial [Bacteroidota bacterium]
MKKISLMLASLVFISMLKAQQLQRIWATDTTLKVPESVCFDSKFQRLFVTNIE